jgi:hypothetical protein
LAIQLALRGGDLRCVDWWAVGVAGVTGAVGGAYLGGVFRHSKRGLSWFSSSHKWENVSKRYRRAHGVADTDEVHHWAIPRNSAIGKLVPDWIKNHTWNLHPVDAAAHQTGIHGGGFGLLRRWLIGTPDWAKAAEVSVGVGAAGEIAKKISCECR